MRGERGKQHTIQAHHRDELLEAQVVAVNKRHDAVILGQEGRDLNVQVLGPLMRRFQEELGAEGANGIVICLKGRVAWQPTIKIGGLQAIPEGINHAGLNFAEVVEHLQLLFGRNKKRGRGEC